MDTILSRRAIYYHKRLAHFSAHSSPVQDPSPIQFTSHIHSKSNPRRPGIRTTVDESAIKQELIDSIVSRIARLKCPQDPVEGQIEQGYRTTADGSDGRTSESVDDRSKSNALQTHQSDDIDGRYSKVVFEMDEANQFFAQSNRYKPSAKLKHKILYRLGYFTFHIPYYEWYKMHNLMTRQLYLTKLLDFKFSQFGRDSEWLEPDDEKDFIQRSIQQRLKLKKLFK